ncbi:F0F1 ATP synthase subunit delta [Aliarcobacter lanthieri]|uniref:F0F1 ATP synthase subunit delta n=1 Tax=Arcobacteraceae TaxID=2808963 RepID=UPI0004797B1E|nr:MULTISPECIES: F0F1 ATP synthase subunit delta [Arcobacteraceae]MBL3519537.1 F0F1 ATP synthase subunit delta [Aliarcobacter lanthieri]QKF59770.1 ATP synthase, F1 complex, delta subunit [Aliarcobacter lanthieri]RBQ27001.1 F0F1 ATP synthase subunit delta [Arcobacter sp. CECT 9188]
MRDLVAKRYVKALIDGRDLKAITEISEKLNEISSAFNSDKFKSIITSPEVSENDKTTLVISLVTGANSALNNFIKLLGEKRRLDLLPLIANDLKIQIAKMNNSYIGVVYTNEELPSNYISSIEEQFSKKFNVKLSLSQKVGGYDGIKVDIDGLGVEISFSKDRLKSQLIDHILKAV